MLHEMFTCIYYADNKRSDLYPFKKNRRLYNENNFHLKISSMYSVKTVNRE